MRGRWNKVLIGVAVALCVVGLVYVFTPKSVLLRLATRSDKASAGSDRSSSAPEQVDATRPRNSDPPWMQSVKPIVLEKPLDGELLVRQVSAAAKLTALEEQRVRDSLQGIAKAQAQVAGVEDLNLRSELQSKLARQAMRELMAAVSRDKEEAVRNYLRDGVPSMAFQK
jgi:hypothetical protein